MSYDQRKGIITLVPKKDKDRTNLKNWRPISLLNFDYKLVANVLANRIINIIPKLIDQTCNIKERFMVKISELFQTLSNLQI